jgi:drug/metabolite transporter (DMT)-like permease
MSWQLLVGLSVVLYSVNGLLHRTIMKDDNSDAYAQAVVFTGLVALFFLIILLFHGGFQLPGSWIQSLFMIFGAVFSSIGMVFTFKGFKSIGASEHTILLTSCQLWNMLGAILFLHESFTITKLVGTFAILFGIVLPEWKKQTFKLNSGAVYVLLAAFCFAGSGIISFYIVRSFDVLSYMSYSGIVVTLILVICRPTVIRKFSFYLKPKRAVNIVTTSLNDAAANILGLITYQIGRNALQIGPISAMQTIVIVLLAIIILKERDHILNKIVGSLAAVAGTILLL